MIGTVQREVTADQWIVESAGEMRLFKLYWFEMSRTDPKTYPTRMTLGEWDEQFRSFIESAIKESAK